MDVSVKDGISRAAVVILRYPQLDVIEAATAERPTTFPYIPGLLSFREGAVILDAMRRLATAPDVFIFDGQGIAHPRRIGIASHIGLFLEVPTVGCAKSRLSGAHTVPPAAKGSWQPLVDRGETIGAVLCTRANVKPVYVSVAPRHAGHARERCCVAPRATSCRADSRRPQHRGSPRLAQLPLLCASCR